MYPLSLGIFSVLTAFSLYHLFWMLVLVWMMKQPRPYSSRSPKTAVLLTLRGADPVLRSTVQCLLNQNYSDYELFIAVDSWDDPAWETIRSEVQREHQGKVHVCELTQRLRTCSLKCSALVQMLGQLNDTFEIVALADADLEPHPSWLAELVAPFDDPSVGATSGYRWFTPPKGEIASLVRHLWNATTVVPMIIGRIPWGGCMAFRASPQLRQLIADKWSRSAVDDVILGPLTKSVGLRVRPIPRLMMPIREECDMQFVSQFVSRQLLWVFTYLRRAATFIFVYSLLLVVLTLAAGGVAAAALARNETAAAGWAAGGLALFWLVMLVLLIVGETTVRNSCRARGDAIPKFPLIAMLRVPVAIVLACYVHTRGVLVAQFTRCVDWRGVRYELRGPWNVRLIEDLPFRVDAAQSLANTSI